MKRWSLIAAGLICSSAACAHNSSAERPDWCAGGRVAVVASFAFTAAEVGDYADCRASRTCLDVEDQPLSRVGGPPGNDECVDCGDEHDDWTGAHRLAQNQCNLYAYPAPLPGLPDLGKVTVHVNDPTSFQDPDHHVSWQRQDIAGFCLRCELPEVPPDQRPE